MIIEKMRQIGTTDSNYEIGTVLWTNPDTTQTFAQQNITLSSNDYDYLLWIFKLNNSDAYNSYSICSIKGSNLIAASTQNWYASSSSYGAAFQRRVIEHIDNITYKINDVELVTGNLNGGRIDNNQLIPIKVIGYKNTIPTVVQKELDNYSTDEVRIGTWIDGKPLYRKVIDFGLMPDSTVKFHNISSTYKVKDMKGFCTNGSNVFPIPASNRSNVNAQIQIYVQGDNLAIGTSISDYSAYNAYITIEYTKTTDTVGGV